MVPPRAPSFYADALPAVWLRRGQPGSADSDVLAVETPSLGG